MITGAADDDPSGIGTYSQVGAQFGYGLAWTMLFSYPLLASIQMICARIGSVSGRGIAHNLRRHYPRPVLAGAVFDHSGHYLGVMAVCGVLSLSATWASRQMKLSGQARY